MQVRSCWKGVGLVQTLGFLEEGCRGRVKSGWGESKTTNIKMETVTKGVDSVALGPQARRCADVPRASHPLVLQQASAGRLARKGHPAGGGGPGSLSPESEPRILIHASSWGSEPRSPGHVALQCVPTSWVLFQRRSCAQCLLGNVGEQMLRVGVSGAFHGWRGVGLSRGACLWEAAIKGTAVPAHLPQNQA